MKSRIFPIFFHGNPGEGMGQRFDTVMIPNGSIAVLNSLAKSLGLDSVAVDESYLGNGNITALELLMRLIEERLHRGEQPVILATVLSYNAGTTLALLAQLKHQYGSRIRVGVGGQLIRTCPNAYLAKPYLDHVAVGDAEATLVGILRGERFQIGHINTDQNGYALPDYDNYWALEERLQEMSRYRLGSFTNIRQLVVESVRGCAWAAVNGVCVMCALDRVDTKPVFRDLTELFAFEAELRDRWGATWCFDVSNQWLPTLRPTGMVDWLEAYCEHGEAQLGLHNRLKKYVYLTANSITPETAKLLRRAGVEVVYVGIDGWDKPIRRALHKAQPSMDRMLGICRDHGLHVRTSLVIGNGVNAKNIARLPGFVAETIGKFEGTIISWGNFIQIVLAGSPVFAWFRSEAVKNGWQEVVTLYKKFERDGFFTWAEQCRLDELFIRHTQDVDYDQLVAARDEAVRIVEASQCTVANTIEHGGAFK